MKDRVVWWMLLVAVPARAGVGWQGAEITRADSGAGALPALDVDGDGDLDLMSASLDRVAWYENLGGSFAPQQVVAELDVSATSGAVADLDGDGMLDLVVARNLDDTVAWYANLGGGSFSGQQLVSDTCDGVQDVEAADLDLDGDADLLTVAYYGPDEVVWYENLGGGVFGGPQPLAHGTTQPDDAELADLDGDGDADVLLAGTGSDEVVWYENLGGVFGAKQLIGTVDFPVIVRAADPNGDGALDVLVGSDSLVVFTNLGGGAFSGPTVVDGDIDVTELRAADVDADGDEDLLAYDVPWTFFGPTLFVWYENLGGSFGSEQILAEGMMSPSRITPADADGDGILDLFTADDGVHWHRGLGGGTFAAPMELSRSASTNAWLRIVDLDGDGVDDVVSASFRDDKVAWYPGRGDGTFEDQLTLFSTEWALQAVPADLDGDGDPDLVTGSSGTDQIAWHENLGAGSFAPDHTVLDGAGWDARPIDADGDGDLDLAVLDWLDDEVAWYENLGSGVLGPRQVIAATVDGPAELAVADLDGDGDPDLVVSDNYGGEIVSFANLGGSFGPEQHVAFVTWPVALVPSDLDGDGDLDLATASRSPAQGYASVGWTENLGGGTFGPHQAVYEDLDSTSLWTVHPADVDGDGDEDLVAALPTGTSWFENLGGGVFGAPVLVDERTGYHIDSDDLDGDGDLDLVVSEGVRISVYLQVEVPDPLPGDTGLGDSGIGDTGVDDTGIGDSGIGDTGVDDTGTGHTGSWDTGTPADSAGLADTATTVGDTSSTTDTWPAPGHDTTDTSPTAGTGQSTTGGPGSTGIGEDTSGVDTGAAPAAPTPRPPEEPAGRGCGLAMPAPGSWGLLVALVAAGRRRRRRTGPGKADAAP